MEPWGTEVDDHRFGMLLTIMMQLTGNEYREPSSWFLRSSNAEKQLSTKKSEQLANVTLARFKAYAATQEATSDK